MQFREESSWYTWKPAPIDAVVAGKGSLESRCNITEFSLVQLCFPEDRVRVLRSG